MTDLAGIRVITLTESDVEKVGEIIKELFNVHPKDSMNKSDSLGTHKVGYRSVHYVCDIGKNRASLREWKVFKGLCFEIQVRTALQHAWAEIEHDRGYKLGGQLPSKISRRFSLLSGLLESADLEFSRLTDEIEKHIKEVEIDLIENKKLDPEITTAGIKALFSHLFSDINYEPTEDEFLVKTIDDLNFLNITDLNILKKMLIDVKEYFKKIDNETELSILTTAILYNNLEEYMEKAWSQSNYQWRNIPQHIIEILSKKYKTLDLPLFFSNYGIQIYNK